MSHSQLTQSHTHILALCVFPLVLPLSLFSQETRVVAASGWFHSACECVHLWHGITHAMGLLPWRDTAQRTPFTASGWKKNHKCLPDSPYSAMFPMQESLAARITKHMYLPYSATVTHIFLSFFSAGVPLGVWWRRGYVGILNPNYLTEFMGNKFRGKPAL